MNENPEGTPNPLNPNPTPVGPAAAPAGSVPVQPMPQDVAPAEPATTIPVNRPAVGEPVIPATPAATVEPARPVEPVPVVEPDAMTGEPKGSVVEPAKKKSKSLIIILIAFIVALIGAAVAALVVFNPFGWFGGGSDDRVPTAIANLFSDGAPTNVKMNGSISLTNNDENSPVSMIDITFISETNTVSAASSANASITATFADESEFTFSVDEVRTEGGDLYLRLNDVATALEDYRTALLEATNCADDDSGETNCAATDATDGGDTLSLLDTMGVFELIDNQWLRLGSDDFNTLTDIASIDSNAQCFIDAAGNLSDYNADFANAYNNNKFIEYTTENLTVAKKKDNLYLISINPSKFTDFINNLPNGFMNDLYACTGTTASNTTISASDVNNIVASLPTIYVEINEDNVFTRVYLKAVSEDGSASVIADIALSYPEKITITEPSEYIDLNTLLSGLLSQFFGTEITEVTEVTEVTE